MKQTILALLLFCVSTMPAASCGGGFLMMLLFQAYPETREVTAATDLARQEGLLDGPEWPGSDVISLHDWRAKHIVSTIGRLEKRVQDRDVQIPNDESAYLFLIYEFQWIEMKASADGLELVRRKHGPDDQATKIFTTRRVLDSLLDRRVGWREAVERRLISLRSGPGASQVWPAVLEALVGERPVIPSHSSNQ